MQAIYSGYLTLAALDAYREEVKRTVSTDVRSFRDRFVYGALGIVGETGEVVELVKAQFYPTYHPHKHVEAAHIRGEACDVLWYIVYLLNLFEIPTDTIHWPGREPVMSADVVYRSLDCSLALGTEVGMVAWLARQTMTRHARIHYTQQEVSINRHCGTMLYYLAWLLDCYDMTLQDAMEASVAKSHARFPVDGEASA